MSPATQASTPYIDYRAYKLARVLAEVLGCGELIGYRIYGDSDPETPKIEQTVYADPNRLICCGGEGKLPPG